MADDQRGKTKTPNPPDYKPRPLLGMNFRNSQSQPQPSHRTTSAHYSSELNEKPTDPRLRKKQLPPDNKPTDPRLQRKQLKPDNKLNDPRLLRKKDLPPSTSTLSSPTLPPTSVKSENLATDSIDSEYYNEAAEREKVEKLDKLGKDIERGIKNLDNRLKRHNSYVMPDYFKSRRINFSDTPDTCVASLTYREKKEKPKWSLPASLMDESTYRPNIPVVPANATPEEYEKMADRLLDVELDREAVHVSKVSADLKILRSIVRDQETERLRLEVRQLNIRAFREILEQQLREDAIKNNHVPII